MTIQWGDTGKVAYGTLKQTTITLPTARESTGLGLTLPTTEPGTPQISYTVQASDLAVFSGAKPLSVMNVPFIFASGRIGAATTTINYRLSVNGTSQIQSNNVSLGAGLYYTYNFGRLVNVNVGDVVTFALWSNQTDTTLVYSAFTTSFTRPQFSKLGTILKDVAYGAATAFPTFSTPPSPNAILTTQNFAILPTTNGVATVGLSTSAITFPTLSQESGGPYYLGRCNYGDVANSAICNTHATNQFYYVRHYLPSSITFREILR